MIGFEKKSFKNLAPDNIGSYSGCCIKKGGGGFVENKLVSAETYVLLNLNLVKVYFVIMKFRCMEIPHLAC